VRRRAEEALCLEGPDSKEGDVTVDKEESDLPKGLAQPARRALAAAGCHNLDDVARRSEAELMRLHGFGKNALERLRQALAATGRTFADSGDNG
jgi:DNA-directed RNA polymerase alpha subunit